ncbi:uncharacterized protein [Vicugna pacos]|uniref:Uncharacterized protein isoform X1 n=1 Tax=Vicugna pacos TaxID=30538 RepID=A0ABM5CZH0_VICPA
MQSVLETTGTEVMVGALGGRERGVLMDYLVTLVKKVVLEKEVPEVFLDSEVRMDAGAGEDPREQEDFLEKRAALVRRVLTAWMENRVIVESQGHLEEKEMGNRGSSNIDGPHGGTGSVGPQGPRGRQGLPGLKGMGWRIQRTRLPRRAWPSRLTGTKRKARTARNFGRKRLTGCSGARGRVRSDGGRQSGAAKEYLRELETPEQHDGNAGLPGPNGSKGKDGPRGMKEERGIPGERGPLGQQGPRGQPGLSGPDGYGRPGRKGTKGEDGDPGPQGEKGAKGIRGKKGNAGLPGFVGPPGDPGPPGPVPCEIIHLAQENCPCSIGVSRCPVFPTDLVFTLDTSNDVSQLEFERRIDIVSLLMKMDISGGTCPTGARVTAVSDDSRTDHLVRFSDYRGRPALLRALGEAALAVPSGSRSLGGATRFLARHLFKRVRSGLLLRKVAVFFQAGWAQDADTISTATLELSVLGVTSAIITFTEGHNLPEALLREEIQGLERLSLSSKVRYLIRGGLI